MASETWFESASAGGALSPDFISRHIHPDPRIRISFSKPTVHELLAIELCDIHIGDHIDVHMTHGLPWNYNIRLRGVLAVVLKFVELYPDLRGLRFQASLGDEGCEQPSLSFSSRYPASILIPDPDFILSQAYEVQKRGFLAQPLQWGQCRDAAYWRGTDTGVRHYSDIGEAPRVRISLLSKQHPELIDAAITATEPRANEAECRAFYEAEGLLAGFEPPETILQYRYQVDIDGNSNAWSALFLKMLSGAPILKVESSLGYRQWYYYRLVPWINFVPIAEDLSDLLDKIRFLKARPELALSIGRNGRATALELTYESQLQYAAAQMLKHACNP